MRISDPKELAEIFVTNLNSQQALSPEQTTELYNFAFQWYADIEYKSGNENTSRSNLDEYVKSIVDKDSLYLHRFLSGVGMKVPYITPATQAEQHALDRAVSEVNTDKEGFELTPEMEEALVKAYYDVNLCRSSGGSYEDCHRLFEVLLEMIKSLPKRKW